MSDHEATLKQRIVAFLLQFENDCRYCLRKDNCTDCRSVVAVGILNDMRKLSQNNKPEIDMSIGARMHRVMQQLRKAKCPLKAKDIYLEDCPKNLKEWTLSSMIKRRMIRRRKCAKTIYEYYIPENKKQG